MKSAGSIGLREADFEARCAEDATADGCECVIDDAPREAVPVPEPADDVPRRAPGTLFGLIELVLQNPGRLHRLIREPGLQGTLVPRFLAISLGGFVLFGVAMSLVLNAAGVWPQLTAVADRLDDPQRSLIAFAAQEPEAGFAARWLDGSAFRLTAAFALGLIAATGVCLPSLYFYGLLTGVRMSMVDVTIHSLKAKATAAVALVGILPIYLAVALGMVIFQAPAGLLYWVLIGGLALPFVGGLWGTRSLYLGFMQVCDTLPAERRERRTCFLRRLVLSWSVAYGAVMPVMIFTLWQAWG